MVEWSYASDSGTMTAAFIAGLAQPLCQSFGLLDDIPRSRHLGTDTSILRGRPIGIEGRYGSRKRIIGLCLTCLSRQSEQFETGGTYALILEWRITYNLLLWMILFERNK
jgi:hypothetical protein